MKKRGGKERERDKGRRREENGNVTRKCCKVRREERKEIKRHWKENIKGK